MTVGIIGAGTMGSGIAQVAATAGCKVRIYDTQHEVLIKAEANLERILNRLIEKERIDEAEKQRIKTNISYHSLLKELGDSQLIIEAIVEDLNIKKNLFKELETYVSLSCIIASNTSSLSIASIAAALHKSERCLGIHFFNPAPLMRLVEIIPAVQTEEKILEKAVQIIESWGKTVAVAKDTPGFIVNRVARPFYGEALRIYEEGIADFVTIDWAMKSLGGFRMGYLQLMDFIGNDINYTVTETVFTAFYYDSRYKPSFTQKRFNEAGYLGRKSGRGYYDYSETAVQPKPLENTELGREILDRILAMLINEAADAVYLGIASTQAIDDAMSNGVNYPKGLLAWANEKGMKWCVEKMDALYDMYREDRYRCSPILRRNLEENIEFEF